MISAHRLYFRLTGISQSNFLKNAIPAMLKYQVILIPDQHTVHSGL